MFTKELVMYVDYINELAILTDPEDAEWKKLQRMRKNLDSGMDLYMEIAKSNPYPGENLGSIQSAVEEQRKRLSDIFEMETVET